MSRTPSWAFQTVECVCGKLLRVRRRRSQRRSMISLGGICECGRGFDLYIEREPASVATRSS